MTTTVDVRAFFALGPLGWGHGTTPAQARETYVATQLRNIPAETTIYRSRAQFEQSLRHGAYVSTVWRAPAGATGFVHTVRGAQWTFDDADPVAFRPEDEVKTP